MPESIDWFTYSLDEIERTSRAVINVLEEYSECLKGAAKDRESGAPAHQVFESLLTNRSREIRLRANEAINAYQNAAMQFRARIVRSLVDDDGMTLSDVARLMTVSRQMAARLYRNASEVPAPVPQVAPEG